MVSFLNRALFIILILSIGYQVSATELNELDTTTGLRTHNQLMVIAYKKGLAIGYPETIQGILQQETRAGKLGRIGNKGSTVRYKSYGVMQIQPDTALFIMRKLWKMNKQDIPSLHELIVRLLLDDEFNINLGTSYFSYLIDKFGGSEAPLSWTKAVLSYNIGPGRYYERGLEFDPNNYIEGVKNNIETVVRPFNEKYNLK
jgi:hypothetical protein